MGAAKQFNIEQTDLCHEFSNNNRAYHGTVKWFNEQKGFGFIQCKELEEDVFVHYTSIEGSGFKTLKTGQMVNFCVVRIARGLQTLKLIVSNDEQP